MMPDFLRIGWLLGLMLGLGAPALSRDYNQLILDRIEKMPAGGTYARYRRDLPESQRFNELYQTVENLGSSLEVGLGGQLKVRPEKSAHYSFCSSATYLLFCEGFRPSRGRGRSALGPAGEGIRGEGVGDRGSRTAARPLS